MLIQAYLRSFDHHIKPKGFAIKAAEDAASEVIKLGFVNFENMHYMPCSCCLVREGVFEHPLGCTTEWSAFIKPEVITRFFV